MFFYKKKNYSRYILSSISGPISQKIRLDPKGFSIIELAIVMLIISILSAVGIQRFQNFAQKARQSEAKLNLSALHSMMQSYYALTSTYSACLNDLGFGFNSATPRYYRVGFNTAAATNVNCGSNPTNKKPCNTMFSQGIESGTSTTCSLNMIYVLENRWYTERLPFTRGTVTITTTNEAQNTIAKSNKLYQYTGNDPMSGAPSSPAGNILTAGLNAVVDAMKNAYNNCQSSCETQGSCIAYCDNLSTQFTTAQAAAQAAAAAAQAAGNPPPAAAPLPPTCSVGHCNANSSTLTAYKAQCKQDQCFSKFRYPKYQCCGTGGGPGCDSLFGDKTRMNNPTQCQVDMLNNNIMGFATDPGYPPSYYSDLFWNASSNIVQNPKFNITQSNDYLIYSSIGWNDNSTEQQFTAQATGVLGNKQGTGPQIGANPTVSSSDYLGIGGTFQQDQIIEDIWTIDHNKTLINLQKGF